MHPCQADSASGLRVDANRQLMQLGYMGNSDINRRQRHLAPLPGKRGSGSTPDRPIRIGEVSELLKITPRAIRHYEQRGLVEADRSASGARLFDETARRRLDWIAKLRLTGIGLRDIEEILAVDERRGGRKRRLQLTIDKLDTRAAWLKANVREIEAAIELMRGALDEGSAAD
jgi:DNA-binding transcriptional MerR regulator